MKKVIEKTLQSKDIIPTPMRILVLELLQKKNSALSLSDMEKTLYPADRTTIYRTLKTFEEKGLAHSFQEDNTSKYALCHEECEANSHHDQHLHLFCRICKKTTCREDIYLPKNTYSSIVIDEIQLHARGICENCVKSTLQ